MTQFGGKKSVGPFSATLPSALEHSSQSLAQRQKTQEDRQKLPIYGCREELIQELRKQSSCIVIGETGSGKTTQIPQYLIEEKLNAGKRIGITQPRRVAAVALSQRVAVEMNTEIGQQVGYVVRFDHCASQETKLIYMTDGILLREAMQDQMLSRYSIVILDEAHERNLRTDVLFSIVKKAQRMRNFKTPFNTLKIIIMSATMDVDEFSDFFGRIPVIYIEGRQHRVDIFYALKPQSDYIYSTLVTIFQIHRERPPDEAILVFLTGSDEIEGVARQCREICKALPADEPKLQVVPLYAALPFIKQLRIFKQMPQNCRKVVVSTNIAETSVTIPDIMHVIDCGKVKARMYQAERCIDMLKVVCISKAQACQRTGRAGREAPGCCYRLFTETDYNNLRDYTEPEITRCNLSGVLLELASMGITDILKFDLISRPSPVAINAAIRELSLLGAIEGDASCCRLTALGKKMVQFPVDPKHARILLAASDLGCLEEALSVVSLMSLEQSIFLALPSRTEDCRLSHLKFDCPEGDQVKMLKAFQGYRTSNQNRNWAQDNFLSVRHMIMAESIRKQLRSICETNDMAIQSCHENMDLLRKALCAGLFLHAAERQPDGKYKAIDSNTKVAIHPSSCLHQRNPGCAIYSELLFTNQCYIRDVTLVDPRWLIEVAPAYFAQKHVSIP